MPIGIVLTEWDSTMGTIIRKSFPKSIHLSKDEVNKILMSHSISKTKQPEIIDLRFQHKIIISFCPKDKIVQLGYSMLIVIFHEDEQSEIPLFKEKLFHQGNHLFSLNYSQRNKYFKQIAYEIFSNKSSRKLLFLGSCGVGKTSIKKIIFESASSDEILNKPMEPTYGLIHYKIDYLDLDLGIADLAGQEIEHFLQDSFDSEIDPFESCDLVVYVFDPPYWETNSQDIINHLKKIRSKLSNLLSNSGNPHIFVLCHKIDLIDPKRINEFKDTVIKSLNVDQDKIFFTSVKSAFLSSLFKAMQVILSNISERVNQIRDAIKAELDEKKRMGIILLQDNKILLEISTSDLPVFSVINIIPMIKSIYNFSRHFIKKPECFYLQVNEFTVFCSELDEFGQEHILLFSPETSINELQSLTEKLKAKVKLLQDIN
ncbi:Rab family GTPase [Candidatus Harpocratesius sp.]